MVRARFAPSPTGDLHLGGAWTALAAWTIARAAPRGVFLVRVEDLDAPRVVPGAEARILEDLRWLGLRWDEGPDVGGEAAPYRQSERGPLYEAALAALGARGLTYPCDCSRAEIARAASAPHAGEETVYPGTCRALDPARAFKRPPAIRLRTDGAGVVAFEDGAMGRVEQNVEAEVGDFVLRRGDGIFAYQLAVAVDDFAMRITDVVRGADLLASTPRQLLLMRLLGAPREREPRYTHVPLVVGRGGDRLTKRGGGGVVRELREAGITADAILGWLARGREGLVVPEEWALRTRSLRSS